MTTLEELIELRRIGDRMQSDLSRILEFVNSEFVVCKASYETLCSVHGAEGAIQDWTATRHKSLRVFAPKPEWCPVCKTYHTDPGARRDDGRPMRPCPLLPLHHGAQHNGFAYYTDGSRTRMEG